jgi:DNA-binding HxlR family transcriptional regulator
METDHNTASGTGGGCPIGSLLRILAGPWTLHIVWILTSEGPTRFGALRERIAGISAKVLTERLRLLETEGFVLRQYEASIPPKVTYAPTDRMRELSPVLCQLNQLAASWYGPAAATGPGQRATATR